MAQSATLILKRLSDIEKRHIDCLMQRDVALISDHWVVQSAFTI